MLKYKTVFVLGAGASMSYGFPSGHELFRRILDRCNQAETNNKVRNDLGAAQCHWRHVADLGLKIQATDFRSIDAFLAKYDQFRDVGKTLIAMELLPQEDKQRFSLQTQEKNWMLTLFEKMEADAIDDFLRNPVAFVTFNYDRSLEFFLQRDLVNRYHATSPQIAKVLQAIPIIHVHGSFGNLGVIPYGGQGEPHETHIRGTCAHRAGRWIKILHEAEDDSTEFQLARRALSDAERIAFIGFGYHPINMKRLGLEGKCGKKYVYATRICVTDPELTEFKRCTDGSFLYLENGDGNALLRNSMLLY
jgi:hypothetical protein